MSFIAGILLVLLGVVVGLCLDGIVSLFGDNEYASER